MILSEQARQPGPANRGKVLVVDDEVQLMTTLCEMLRQEGFEVQGFSAGDLAVAALRREEFDIVLADLMMPGIDGITVLREGQTVDSMLVGIIMTGQGTVTTAVEAMKIGAFDYLLKPFKFSAMLPLLERAMQVRRLRMENVQLRETVSIYELNQAIALALDVETILNRVADVARQECDADEISILLPVGNDLSVELVRGEGRAHLVGSRQPFDGPGIAAWVARERRPVVLQGPVADPRFAPIQPRAEIQSSVCMPMIAGNQLIGVLNVNVTGRRQRFTPGQVKGLNILAGTAAAALANARLLDRVRRAEANYRSIIENAQDGIFQALPDGQFMTVNPAMARMFGYESPTAMMDSVANIAKLYMRDEDRLEMFRLLATQDAVKDYEHLVRHRDGRARWFTANAQAIRDDHGALVMIEGTVHDVTERKQRERQLLAIAQLSAALRGAAKSVDMLPIILDQVMALLEVEAADVDFPDAETDEFVVTLGRGAWAQMTGGRIAAADSLSGQAVAHARPIANLVVQDDPRLLYPERFGAIKYATCVPLGAHGHPLGALWVGHNRELSDEEVRLLAAIADIAANALRRATLHDQTQQRAEQLAAVNRLGRALAESLDLMEVHRGLVEAIETLLPGTSAVYLWLLDAARTALQCAYGVSGGLPVDLAEKPAVDLQAAAATGPALAAARNAPVVAPPADGGGRPALYVPMAARGGLVGVLQVESGRPGPYTADETELLALVANTAAVAVENASLFAETERRLRRLSGLRAIDQAITSSVDLRVTLNVLLDQVTSQLGVSAADILVLNPHLRMLEFGAARGFRTVALQRTRLALGEGYAGRAALERRVVNIPELRGRKTDFLRSPHFTQENFVSYFGVPLVAKGDVKGVLELFHRTRLEADREWLDYLETLAGQAAIAIDNVTLFDELQRSNADLTVAYDATIEGWSRALDLRDRETEGHTERVTEMTLLLARAVGISEQELVHVRRGALLHDIGKMGIPDSILLKPGPLSEQEWEIMRRHPTYAYEMLSPIAYLRPALDIPYCHHERWDGGGYPRGLKGQQTPLVARVFAVADVWDALRSDRPYRVAWPEAEVRAYIRQQSGAHFDPRIVNIFLNEL